MVLQILYGSGLASALIPAYNEMVLTAKVWHACNFACTIAYTVAATVSIVMTMTIYLFSE